MSSPPTPNTSVKAAPLCPSKTKVRGTSFSFPSIATFNIFRKKLPRPRPCSPVEPYEIAPRLCSTDATAKAYDYLDNNDRAHELRVPSAEPDIQAAGWKERGTEPHKTAKFKDESEAPTQLKQKGWGEERSERGSNWIGIRRGTMRTVSRDDQLVERGANPRTGLVSPFVVSDAGEDCLGGDYITVAQVGSTDPSSKKKTCSGKWKQNSLGWSLVESSHSSPTAQTVSDKMGRMISANQSQDRLPVHRPGTIDLDPKTMTDEQIKQYQEGIARAYERGGGSIAMLDPDTLPSPRQWTPVGPSTPPAKLRKIRRKEVGIDVIHDRKSSDTVIMNAPIRTACVSIQRKDIMEWHKVRIITPSNTPKGSSFESCENVSNAMGRTGPFLGRESRIACSQITSATQSQSFLNPAQEHQNHQKGSESSQLSTLSDSPAASQTWSQHLPGLQLLHPSRPVSLERSLNSCPTQLRPKTLEEQMRAVEDACTTTFTTISAKGPGWEQRPKMCRQDENYGVPRVNHLSSRCGEPLKGHRQQSTPRSKQRFPGDLSMNIIHTLGLLPKKNQATGRPRKVDPVRNLVIPRCLRETQINADCLRQPPCEDQPLSSPTRTIQKSSHESVNLTREPAQQNQNGDGCTPTFDHRGDLCDQSWRLKSTCHDMVQATLPAEVTNSSESMAWVAGKWVAIEENYRHPGLSTLMPYSEEDLGEPSARLSLIQHLFHRTIRHFTRTLHHALLALTTLRMANATIQDQFKAMNELGLAAVYLLVLLISLMILREVVVIVYKVLYSVWHPIHAILRIIGWCLVG